MNKKYLALLLALTSFASQSSVFSSNGSALAELKDTPATKYELGVFKLENYVYTVNHKLKNKRIGKTHFKFKKAEINEDNNQIQIIVTAIGRSKYLTESQCEVTKTLLSAPFNINEATHHMWSGLSEEIYAKLQNEISLNVILMDKENASLTRVCQ